MTTFILLRIEDDTEAQELIEDTADYPGDPLLTPTQEHTVYATIEEWSRMTDVLSVRVIDEVELRDGDGFVIKRSHNEPRKPG